MGPSWKSSALLSLLASSLAAASPVGARYTPGTCTVNQRKEWRTLTDEEKSAYLTAEKCLMTSPAKSGIENAVTRWDELQWAHIVQSNDIHGVGQFLPWHRAYVRLHEKLLQTECNYTGAQPYWDWTKDASYNGSLAAAPVFGSDELSFGTNGQGAVGGGIDGSACVTDGAFANTTLRFGQVFGVTNHTEYCLSRSFETERYYWDWANSTVVDGCFAEETYTGGAFDCYRSHPHSSVHLAVGGTLKDQSASPGDPIFFLHHTNLDRLWWLWQAADLPSRLEQMGGRNVPTNASLIAGSWLAPTAAVLDYDGDPANVTTMNHNIWMVGLMDNITVADTMDTRGDFACAEYVDDNLSGSDPAW
ncbi:unnamed protein product [Discula destructiva]